MAKEDIFSLINIKDYNNVLEQMLEKKDFSEDTKNLLLNMFYKIENSYEDYEKVKINVETKREYIKDLLEIIDSTKKINLVKPSMEEAKVLVESNKSYIIDKEKREITVYQNEEALLKALFELDYTMAQISKDYELYEKGLKELFFYRIFIK